MLRSGHSLLLSFSKHRAALADTAQSLGARSGTPSEAVEFADVVVLTTPWLASAEALSQVGNIARKKILWDCTNPLKPDLTGLLIGTNTSGGEEVAKLAPWAHVVKAIPPFAEQLHAQGGLAGSVFVCGDDAGARQAVMQLVQDIGAAADRSVYGTSLYAGRASCLSSESGAQDRTSPSARDRSIKETKPIDGYDTDAG